MTGVGEIDALAEACFAQRMFVRSNYLALERKAARWQPAPMPSSFERPWEDDE